MAILPDGPEVAKEYADRGWQVVILHSSLDGECTCSKGADCPSPGKHPRQRGWQRTATTDPDTINSLFQKWPNSNLGVRLGPASGIVDVEFDNHEGRQTSKELLGEIYTPTFMSDRSLHRLFQFPSDMKITKAVEEPRGLEIRFGTDAKGAQTVFPPSIHATGKTYHWLSGLSPDDVDTAPFPDVLRDLLTSAPSNGQLVMQEDIESIETHIGANQGHRNRTLCQLVGSHMRQHGITPELPSLAMAWADRCQPPMDYADVVRTVTALIEKEQAKKSAAEQQSPLTGAPAGVEISLRTTPFSEFNMKEPGWLWENRIGLSKLTMIAGDAGLGKTTVAIDIAARVTRGDSFPDGSPGIQGEVGFLSDEDDPDDTIGPRLMAAGAVLDKVHHIDGLLDSSDGRLRYLDFGRHLEALERMLKQFPNFRLLIVDPISSYLGDSDTHQNSGVRAILSPLCRLAAKYRFALLTITHLNKDATGSALHRVSGSIAFAAMARTIWSVQTDPDADGHLLFLPIKNNIGDAAGLSFRREPVMLSGFKKSTPRIEWHPEPVYSCPDDLKDKNLSATKREKAELFLEAETSAGRVLGTVLIDKAKGHDIHESTLRRAAKDLGITTKRIDGRYWWIPPENEDEVPA